MRTIHTFTGNINHCRSVLPDGDEYNLDTTMAAINIHVCRMVTSKGLTPHRVHGKALFGALILMALIS